MRSPDYEVLVQSWSQLAFRDFQSSSFDKSWFWNINDKCKVVILHYNTYLYNLPYFRGDQSAATLNLVFGSFGNWIQDERTSYLSADRRHHWQGLVAFGSQQRPKHDSNFNLRRGLIPTKNSKGSSLKAQETLVWDHQTMRFLYSLGLSWHFAIFNPHLLTNLDSET